MYVFDNVTSVFQRRQETGMHIKKKAMYSTALKNLLIIVAHFRCVARVHFFLLPTLVAILVFAHVGNVPSHV